MEGLKPCPFCGKKPVWHIVGEANDLLKFGCPDGCVEWIQAFTKPHYENALHSLEARWNRRAAPENKPLTWTSANEKLFNMDERSRIFVSDSEHVVLIYKGHMFRNGDGKLQAPGRYGGGIDVLYWMPMPEPPKAREPEGREP